MMRPGRHNKPNHRKFQSAFLPHPVPALSVCKGSGDAAAKCSVHSSWLEMLAVGRLCVRLITVL